MADASQSHEREVDLKAREKSIQNSLQKFVELVTNDLISLGLVQKENAEMKAAAELLLKELERCEVTLSNKNNEVSDLRSKLNSFCEQRNEFLKMRQKVSEVDSLLTKTQYEKEILQTRIKVLEREVVLQKNEIERVRKEAQMGHAAKKKR